jgi:hypothetical protein
MTAKYLGKQDGGKNKGKLKFNVEVVDGGTGQVEIKSKYIDPREYDNLNGVVKWLRPSKAQSSLMRKKSSEDASSDADSKKRKAKGLNGRGKKKKSGGSGSGSGRGDANNPIDYEDDDNNVDSDDADSDDSSSSSEGSGTKTKTNKTKEKSGGKSSSSSARIESDVDDDDDDEVVCWGCGAVEEPKNMIICNGYTDVIGKRHHCQGLYHRACIVAERRRQKEAEGGVAAAAETHSTPSKSSKGKGKGKAKSAATIDEDDYQVEEEEENDDDEDGLSLFDASTWRCDRCAGKETAARAREEAMRLKQMEGGGGANGDEMIEEDSSSEEEEEEEEKQQSQDTPSKWVQKRREPVKFGKVKDYREARDREKQRLCDVKQETRTRRMNRRKGKKSQKGGGEAAANSAEKKAIEVNNQDEAEQFKDPSLLNPYETFRGRSGTSNMTTRNSQRQQESERQEDADFSQQSQQQLSQSSQGESAAAAETEAEFKARVEVRLNGNFVEKLKPHQLAGVRFLFSHIVVSTRRLRRGDQVSE